MLLLPEPLTLFNLFVLFFYQVEAERNELMVRVNVLKDEIKILEEQFKDMTLRLSEIADDASKYKAAATQMK